MKLFYKSYGESGEAVFILHGIFGMLDNWHTVARTLSSQYKVYAIDARNHGQSPHSEEMGYEIMADDLIELADDLGIQKFILIGHSMGGKTAMTAAIKYPERISKLVVVDIAPKSYKAGHQRYFDAFEGIDWSSLNTRKDIDDALAKYEDEAGIRLFLAKNIDRSELGGFIVKSNIPALKKAYQEIIGEFPLSGEYKYPSLFITGEKSGYLKESDKATIEKHFTKTQYAIVSGAGHWVHADNPKEFLEKLSEFLG